MRPVDAKFPITLGYRQKANFDPNYIHRGIDFGVPQGTQVSATIGGKVIYAADARKSSAGSYGPAYGIQIIIQVGSIYCLYAHLSKVQVAKGDTVKIGQHIGLSGATGNVTGAHLHYQENTKAPSAYTSDRNPQFITVTTDTTPPAGDNSVSKTYYPKADIKTQNFSAKYPGDVMDTNCLILHSTEGYGWPAYSSGAVAPNMTIAPNFDKQTVEVRQHFPANRSSRALENHAGGVETNTANVFQIELVGTCDPTTHKNWKNIQHIYMPEAPQWFIDGVADVVKWLHESYPKFQIKDGSPRGWGAYPGSYGASKYRMSNAEWGNFYGIAGHQHVPENVHGDPGNFPIARLVASALGKPATVPDPDPSVDKMDPKAYFIGAVGNHVKWLADRLVAHGFGSFYVNGTDTTFTAGEDQKAVKAFQESQGWTGSDADGFPGSQTLTLLAAEAPTPNPDPEVPVTKVLTLNVMTYNPSDKLGNTVARAKAVAENVNKFGPDIISFQELTGRTSSGAGSAWSKLIGTALGSKWKLITPTTAFNENYIAYRVDKLELVKQLPDHIIRIPGGDGKHCSMAVFKDKASGRKFAFGDTHLDPYCSLAVRAKQCVAANDAIKAVAVDYGHIPYMLCGDFNVDTLFTQMKVLNRLDVGHRTTNLHNWEYSTFSGTSTKLKIGKHLDYITVGADATVESAEVVMVIDTNGKKYKSPKGGDHQPKAAVITYK